MAGSQKEHAAAVSAANGLVRSGQPRVCLLHGGIEALRTVLELPINSVHSYTTSSLGLNVSMYMFSFLCMRRTCERRLSLRADR